MSQARFILLAILLAPLALPRSAGEGVYTKAQAARGQATYAEECAKCHAENLAGGDGSPELAGAEFLSRWNGKTVADLFEFMRKTMPTDDPGHLSTRQYSDLAAYILSANDFPAGANDLDRDPAVLKDIRIDAKK